MGRHKRDKSDSHIPLRQSEIQATFNAEELQVNNLLKNLFLLI